MTGLTQTEEAPFDLSGTSEWWLVPARLFDGDSLRHGLALRVSGKRIAAVCPAVEAGMDGAPVWRTGCLAVPGFFDVQINGGGGVLFNTTPSVEGLAAIAAAHRVTGTTAFLPTLITDAPDVIDKAADAVIAAYGYAGVAGIHLEGPHISVARKGAHNPDFIRPIDEHTFSVVSRLKAAMVPVLITLAPECVPPGTIARLVAMGAVVSLGHTAANEKTVRAATAEGASSVTHLFNGMPPMTSREPGVVGAALDSDIYCSFIADGYHVDDTVLRLAIRARPQRGRMVLVSDAMPTVNGPDQFELYGETIRVMGGKLVNRNGSLAGVHIDMRTSLQRLVKQVGLSVGEALATATSVPASLMGLQEEIGSLKEGVRADIVLLDRELECRAVIPMA